MNSHTFRLYYLFIPHLIRSIAQDHYEHVDHGGGGTLLSKMAIGASSSASDKPIEEKIPHNLAIMFRRDEKFFPFKHQLLLNRGVEKERELYQDHVFTEIAAFLHFHYRSHSLGYILPWRKREKDQWVLESDEHYRARIKKYLLPLTTSVMNSFNKDETIRHLEEIQEVSDQNRGAAELESGLTDEDIEVLSAKPVEGYTAIPSSEVLKLMKEGDQIQIIYFENLGNSELINPALVAITKSALDQFHIEVAFEGNIRLVTDLNSKQIQDNLSAVILGAHQLIALSEEKGGISFEDQVLYYDPATDQYGGSATNTKDNSSVEFAATRSDIAEQTKNYPDTAPEADLLEQKQDLMQPKATSPLGVKEPEALPYEIERRRLERESEKRELEKIQEEEHVYLGKKPNAAEKQTIEMVRTESRYESTIPFASGNISWGQTVKKPVQARIDQHTASKMKGERLRLSQMASKPFKTARTKPGEQPTSPLSSPKGKAPGEGGQGQSQPGPSSSMAKALLKGAGATIGFTGGAVIGFPAWYDLFIS